MTHIANIFYICYNVDRQKWIWKVHAFHFKTKTPNAATLGVFYFQFFKMAGISPSGWLPTYLLPSSHFVFLILFWCCLFAYLLPTRYLRVTFRPFLTHLYSNLHKGRNPWKHKVFIELRPFLNLFGLYSL